MAVSAIYEFGDFRLDATQRLLQAKDGGRPLPLTAKAFDTLLYFVEHPRELLDKSRLLSAIWPNVVVEENTLNQNISLLRRVLGECPGEYRFIVTVPGRGYRFIADVRRIGDVGSAANSSSAVHPKARSRTAIGVLPFVNLTGDPTKVQLGDSLAEGLINTLMRVRWFTVAARTSSFAYRGTNMDVRQIARELDVDAVLEGSIRTAGDCIRVTAQLVDGRLGHHIWSESYDRSAENLSEVQDELTVAIVDAVAGYLILGARGRKAPSRDLQAYHLYLRAMMLRSQPSEHNLQAAVDLLERATLRDSQFARSWYALADARAFAAANGFGGIELLDHAERDAQRSLALDPSLSSAHAVLGVLRACRKQWIAAEREFRNARALVARNPEALVYHAVYVSGQVGHRRRALEETEAAYETAPASPGLAFRVGAQLLLHGDNAGARRWIETAVANGHPTTLRVVSEMRAHLAMREKRYQDAARELVETLPPASRAAGGCEAIQSFYEALAEPSKTAEGIACLQDWLDRLDAKDLDRQTGQRAITWFTLLGAVDAAHDTAVRLLDSASSGVIGCGWEILWIDEMLAFRSSARFAALTSRLGLDEYWSQYGPPDGYLLRNGALAACRV